MAQRHLYFSTNWQWKNSLLRSSNNTGWACSLKPTLIQRGQRLMFLYYYNIVILDIKVIPKTSTPCSHCIANQRLGCASIQSVFILY